MKFVLFFGVALLSVVSTAQVESPSQPSKPADSTSLDQNALDKIDPAKVADIRKLFDVVGTRKLMTQIMSGMESGMKPMLRNSLPPGEYREKLVDLFFEKFHSRVDTDHLLDLLVPIYDRHLSHEEIRGLLEFYSTPLGQKSIQALPQIMSESQDVGRQWGENLGRQSMLDVLKEHPDLAKAAEDARHKASQNNQP